MSSFLDKLTQKYKEEQKQQDLEEQQSIQQQEEAKQDDVPKKEEAKPALSWLEKLKLKEEQQEKIEKAPSYEEAKENVKEELQEKIESKKDELYNRVEAVVPPVIKTEPEVVPEPEPEVVPEPEPVVVSEPEPEPVVEEEVVEETSEEEEEIEEKEEEDKKGGFFSFLKGKPKDKEELKEDLDAGLKKSNASIFERLSKAVAGRSEVDMDVLDDIEMALVESDINIDTTSKIIERLEERVARDKYLSEKEVYQMLKEEIIDLLTENNTPDYESFEIPDTGDAPYILLVVGVNGVGKTTTIGKLAYQFKRQGKKVMLGAADTFRAAATEQLTIWSERVDVPIVKQKMGADPAAVSYDTVDAAVSRGVDVAIIDTAGRLHNKKHLMDELSKIKRVMKKVHPDFPHDVLLVLDGSTGQNALMQAEAFTKATEVTSIAVTKLDGTAKGGAVIAIADQFKVPIKYIGVGEGIEHLQVFNKTDFVDSLFKETE